jgi:quercetin dioxygenase-like cupin family protein
MKSDSPGLSYYLLNNNKNYVRGVAHVKPDFIGDIHTHVEPERYTILKGQGILHLGGQERELFTGDCIYIGSNIPHAFVATGGNTVVLMFEFDSGPLEKIKYTYTGKTMKQKI